MTIKLQPLKTYKKYIAEEGVQDCTQNKINRENYLDDIKMQPMDEQKSVELKNRINKAALIIKDLVDKVDIWLDQNYFNNEDDMFEMQEILGHKIVDKKAWLKIKYCCRHTS